MESVKLLGAKTCGLQAFTITLTYLSED